MKISVNIVTWNGEKYIESCIQSVLNQSFEDYAILIIDNGSTDDTLGIINERFPHLKVVKHKENLGFAKAHNQGIHWSKSDYVLCLNQDLVLQKDFLQNMVNFMDHNSDVGAATGKLFKLNEDIEEDIIDTCGLKVYKNMMAVDIGEGEIDSDQYSKPKQVFGVSGAAPVYRRIALESVKYNEEFFDEDFFSYKEDVDLAFRLKYMGWKSCFVPQAKGYHVRSVGAQKNQNKISARKQKSEFANYHSYRNQLLLAKKDIPSKNLTYILPVSFYEFKKFVYVLFMERKSWKAWPQYHKLKKKIKQKRNYILENKKVSDQEIKSWFE